jgi:hypothetical protein
MNVGRGAMGGAGTQNSALAFGGLTPLASSCTEAFDGTSWTVKNAMITTRVTLSGAGASSNSALAFGGSNISFCTCTEAYNGTSWSAGGAMITARASLAGAGTQNAALGFGGLNPLNVTCTEAYNGITWTTQTALITARNSLGGAGTVSSALAFGGKAPTALSCTEAFNGVGWSTRAAMNTARNNVGGAGTQTQALVFGGETNLTTTEAFNDNQILLGGNFTAHSGSTYSGSVRLNISGTLDTTYNIGSGFGNTTAVNDYIFTRPTLQSGGPILAGGNFTFYLSSLLFPQPSRIALLNADGTISGSKAFSPITWTKVAEYTEATSGILSGSTIAMFYGVPVANVSSSITYQVLTSAPVSAKAVTGWTYTSNYKTFPYTGSFSSSVNDNPPPMSLAGALNLPGNYILARGIAFKGPGTSLFITSSGFTPFTGSGTTGGTDFSNMSIAGEFIITGSDVISNPIYSGSLSNSSIYYAIYEQAGKTYYILLD